MKNVIRTTTSGFKNKVRGGGVLSKTLLTTAIFTALTATSVTAHAQTYYLGPFPAENVTSSALANLSMWGLLGESVGSTNGKWTLGTGAATGLVFTVTKDTTPTAGSIVLQGLGVSDLSADTDPYVALASATGITVLTLAGEADGATTQLTVGGVDIEGTLAFAEAKETVTGLTGTTTLLQIGDGTNQLGVSNTGDLTLEVTSTGGNALAGLTVKAEATYTGTGAETYILSSDDAVTGVTMAGTGVHNGLVTINEKGSGTGAVTGLTITGSDTYKAGFTATVQSTGADVDLTQTTLPGAATAVTVGANGTGKWEAGFSATATAGGLSPAATALSVTAATGTIDISGGAITASAVLGTADPASPELTNGYTATAISYAGNASGTISGHVDAVGDTTPAKDYAVSITSELTINGAGDLWTKDTGGALTFATASGISMSAGTLSVTAGALASGNEISATVKEAGGALTTTGSSANAYAVNATGGTLNISLADTKLTAGKSSAILDIKAENGASFDTGVTGTATAAAIYAGQGTSSTAGTVNIDANAGTINISAEAAGGTGSQAYGVWAQGGAQGVSNVVLYGTNQMVISATGGAQNEIFAKDSTKYELNTSTNLKISNAAIFADGRVGTNAGNVIAGVANLTVNGAVVATSAVSGSGSAATGTITFTGDKDSFTPNPDSDIDTNTTIDGNLYALYGGTVTVGSTNSEASDEVTVTGDTYIIGSVSTSAVPSSVTVEQNGIYTAQGSTIVANGGTLVVKEGGTYNAQDVTVSSAGAQTIPASGINVQGTMNAYGDTTLTAMKTASTYSLQISGAVGKYNALGNLTIGVAPTTSGTTVTIDKAVLNLDSNGTLQVGDETHNVTATINLGGSITGTGTVEVANGSTLALTTAQTLPQGTSYSEQPGALIGGATVTSKILGTVQILGSNLPAATEENQNPNIVYYAGGLGTMNIEDGGSIVGDDGGLYLKLVTGDTLTFNGGTMEANGLNVDTGKLTITEGDVSVTGKLLVGSTAQSLAVQGGTLTLAEPTPASQAGGLPTSSLSMGVANGLSLTDDGVLVTNSQNLWDQAASEATEATKLTTNIGGNLTITPTGGFIELTDEKVDASWLIAAHGQGTENLGAATLIIEQTIYQGNKPLSSVLPHAPSEGSKPAVTTLGYDQLMGNRGVIASTELDASNKSFTLNDKTTNYENLVIGGPETTKTPWTQKTGKTAWSINSPANATVGFSSIKLGENGQGGNILVTNGNTLFLTGTGPTASIVSGTGNNIFVGTGTGAASAGTLLFGSMADTGIAKGGTYEGTITVTNGSFEVGYADYSVIGQVILGVAPTGSSDAPGATGASFGTLTIDSGSLTVQSINGPSVQAIGVDGGTLKVSGDLIATLNNQQGSNGEIGIEVVDNGHLIVNQTLQITSKLGTSPVGLLVDDGDVQVGANLTATNANVGVLDGSIAVSGDFTQRDTATTGQRNNLVLIVANSGEETATTLQVNGNMTTTANQMAVSGNSAIIVDGDLTVAGQAIGTPAQQTTTLMLDGGQVSAANITLQNVSTGTIPAGLNEDIDASYYVSGDVAATSAITLSNSDFSLDSGSVRAATLTVGSGSDLDLGVSAGDFAETNENLVAAGLPAVEQLVVTAEIGTLSLESNSNVAIQGAAAAGNSAISEVAIGTLVFDTTAVADDPIQVTVQSGAALILGSSSVDSLDRAALDAFAETDTPFTNYLVAGQTVNMGDNNGFAIGAGVDAQNSGVNIGATTAVAVDTKALALSGGVSNKEVTLFNYVGEETGTEAPAVTIADTAQFVITNPVGNMKINVAKGFDASGVQVLPGQVQTTNPLYDAVWYVEPAEDAGVTPAPAVEGDPEPVNSAVISVEIDPDEVSGQTYSLNSLGTQTILEAADMGYGVNEGANTILDLLSGVTSRDQYAAVAAKINKLALQGAAAHAHEIGISAASMVVDSVWDHSSKLAAAPHEEAKADLWITLDWNHSRANDYKAGGLDNGYKLDLYGATFGADYDFANGLAAGLAVSVGGGEAKSKGFNAGQKTDVTYWGINLYGTYTGPIVNVIGNVGYIGIKNKTKIGGDKGRPDANIWTIGVKAEKDFAINEQFTVTPHVGVRYLSVDVDDFNLQGFHYGTDKANLVQFPIGVAFAANLKTANGAAVKPFLDLSFVPTAGDKNVNNTFGIQGGTMSDTIDTTIASGAMFQGKIGVNASYGAHNFGLNFAIGGGNKGRLDTGLQAKYRFVF